MGPAAATIPDACTNAAVWPPSSSPSVPRLHQCLDPSSAMQALARGKTLAGRRSGILGKAEVWRLACQSHEGCGRRWFGGATDLAPVSSGSIGGFRSTSSVFNPLFCNRNSCNFGSNRADICSSLRSHARNYFSLAADLPRLAQVCAQAEHSAALVDQDREVDSNMEEFVEVAHKLADTAGAVIMKYFRTRFEIISKNDLSPVTIADRAAEDAMRGLIAEHFPAHGIYGEEGGLNIPEGGAEYVWVLDPIDGTKSFITGKPVFGTLIALVHKGVPVLGIIDQPVLQERWVGRQGQISTLNGQEIGTRSACTFLKDAYLYTTSPHLFAGEAEEAFIRVRNQVKIPLYGCDCYAYGLLAAGHVDLVIESGLKPYDFLALVPVVEGAGGVITDWQGQKLRWWPDSQQPSTGEMMVDVVAAGSESLHKAALSALA